MSDYQTGIEGMSKLLDCCDGRVMEYFQKKNYADSFQKMYQENIATFDAIEKVYIEESDKEKVLSDMAAALTGYATRQMNECTRKSKREHLQMDLNLTMAVFVLPMVLEFHGESSKPLSEKLVESWKEAFPKSNIQAAEYATIESGFHKTWCYITTAVCRAFGKPDDCYELTTLREYRDTYLAESPGGAELILEYYDKAPSIVKHIDQQPDACDIYQSIWDEWLAPCISMIESDRKEECREHYVAMVHTLQGKYFHLS
ncbi:MAG: hypothetical protein LUF35_13560 [Lachnospiraceae bacterium]|nr:hypothetical protein [Lachnospiraceae bacterium]